MRVSVVILTYNGGEKLKRVAALLRRQNVPAEVELIALDSGSTDGTVQDLRSAGFHIHTLARDNFAFGPVRDQAFALASGEIIVTQSQDVVPMDEEYLRLLTHDIMEGRADVVQGICSPPVDEDVFLWDRDDSIFYFTTVERDYTRRYGPVGLSCTSLAISRAAWQATGFGDSPFGEDKLLQRRLVEKGFRISRSPRPVAWHGHSYNLRSLAKRVLNEGVGWRSAGVRYPLWRFGRDLTLGFARNLPAWARAVVSGQARGAASILFFQIRPVCLLIGNRLLRHVLL
jgi:rhamnosyltransferase